MRLSKRVLQQRLDQVRARARSARTHLAAVRTEPCAWPLQADGPPPLPSRGELLCGKCCEAENSQSPARRGNARELTGGTILLKRLGRPDAHLHLQDISAGGFQIFHTESMQPNDHVVTRLPGLEPIGATVAWAEEGRAGLRFDRALHPAVFELLLTRIG